MAFTIIHWIRVRHAYILSRIIITDKIIAEANQATWTKAAPQSWVTIIYL